MSRGVYVEIDLAELVHELDRDDERVDLLRALVESIHGEGTITKMREIVNSPEWND